MNGSVNRAESFFSIRPHPGWLWSFYLQLG